MLTVLITSLSLTLAACAPEEKETASSERSSLAGVYQGTALAYNGEISVSVELDEEGKILAIDIGENEETPDIGTVPIEKTPKLIIDSQSLDVDNISGATITRDAIVKFYIPKRNTKGNL